MAKDKAGLRQRSKAASQPVAADIKLVEQEDVQLTAKDLASYYFAQHIGLVFCIIGVALLWAGYDRNWMHNTTLSLLSLGICLVGWFFHELRPFNAQKIYEEELEEKKAASEAAR